MSNWIVTLTPDEGARFHQGGDLSFSIEAADFDSAFDEAKSEVARRKKKSKKDIKIIGIQPGKSLGMLI